MVAKKKVKIGFLGMGTVAQGVWKHLQKSREQMSARFGMDYELDRVGVRNPDKPREVNIPKEKLTKDLMSVATDSSIDIVCELMGGTTDALKLTLAALEAGKIVVSANKALICEYGEKIFSTAQKFGGVYFFEASVAGGIPIIKILREGLVANRFSKIYGILNGTCNYILTRMERENAPYESIIADARRLGYVEADESLDIDGFDAAHKIAILSYLAHGMWIKPPQMILSGIRGVRLEDMQWARENDYRIKLIAAVRRIQETGAISVSVYPSLVPLSDVVANVNEVYNAVSLTGDVVGTTVHIGRGAGQDATASAVIADIADAIKSITHNSVGAPICAADEGTRLARLDEVFGEYYLRLEVKDEAGVLAEISTILAKSGISIELLQQKKHITKGRAWLLLTTHSTSEAAIRKACEELKGSQSVFGDTFLLRILG